MSDRPDRRALFTDFKDPFDLLTDLHTTRLRMVYENTFARGNREDMNMGYKEHPNSSTGRVFSPNFSLPVNAPMSEWKARTGSGGVLPPPKPIDYQRDYGDSGIDRGEWKRFGSALRPIGAAAHKFGEDLYERRKKAKYQPLIDRLESINQEMDQTRHQMEDVRLNMSETRMQERHRNQINKEEKALQKAEKAKEKGESPSPITATEKPVSKDFNKEENTMTLQLESPLHPIPPHLENRAKNAREKASTDLSTRTNESPLVTPENPPSLSSTTPTPGTIPSMSPSTTPKVKQKNETIKKRRPSLNTNPWQSAGEKW